MDRQITFGMAILEARKRNGLSQRELAALVRLEDGRAISPQYLNDIEHDRRSPKGDHLIGEFARILGESGDYLCFLAGSLPADIRGRAASPELVERSMRAFRRSIAAAGGRG